MDLSPWLRSLEAPSRISGPGFSKCKEIITFNQGRPTVTPNQVVLVPDRIPPARLPARVPDWVRSRVCGFHLAGGTERNHLALPLHDCQVLFPPALGALVMVGEKDLLVTSPEKGDRVHGAWDRDGRPADAVPLQCLLDRTDRNPESDGDLDAGEFLFDIKSLENLSAKPRHRSM